MSQEHALVLVSALEAFNVRNIDALEPLFDDEIEWEPTLAAGGEPMGTVYRGKEGMRRYLAALDREFDGFRLEVESFDEVVPDRILFRGRVKAQTKVTGMPIDVPMWALWEIRDNRLYRGWSFFSEREALEATRPSD